MGNSKINGDIIIGMDTCTNADCPNWGKLVVDANVVRYVLGGTIQMIGERHGDKSWAQKLPHVQSELRSNLDLIKKCSCDGQLYISAQVLSDELDVGSLRGSAHPADRSQSVYSKNEVGILQQIVFDCIHVPVETSNSEIVELQQLLRSHGLRLDNRDTSLMLVACKLSQNGSRSVIITDDPDFYGPWIVLVQLGGFPVQGTNYRTDNLMLRGYTDFVTLAHDCCSCMSDKYMALWNAWLFPHIERKIKSLNQSGRTNLYRRISKAIHAMEVSINNKGKLIDL